MFCTNKQTIYLFTEQYLQGRKQHETLQDDWKKTKCVSQTDSGHPWLLPRHTATKTEGKFAIAQANTHWLLITEVQYQSWDSPHQINGGLSDKPYSDKIFKI